MQPADPRLIDQAAQAMRLAVVQPINDQPLPPWEKLHPSEQDRYRRMVRAALPVVRAQAGMEMSDLLLVRRDALRAQWGDGWPIRSGQQQGLEEAARLCRVQLAGLQS